MYLLIGNFEISNDAKYDKENEPNVVIIISNKVLSNGFSIKYGKNKYRINAKFTRYIPNESFDILDIVML